MVFTPPRLPVPKLYHLKPSKQFSLTAAMCFALVAHLYGNLAVVSGASTGRVSGRLLEMWFVRVKMNQVLRSVRLQTKRLSGLIWTPGDLVAILAEEGDVVMDMVLRW